MPEFEYTAPIPDGLGNLLPVESPSFGKDLWSLITRAIGEFQPEMGECLLVCVSLFAVVMLVSAVKSANGKTAGAAELVGVLAVSLLLMDSASNMISLASETVQQLSEYGKLLLPVMTAAMASQGGLTTSTALYTGTAIFDAVLCGLISNLLVPLLYLFLLLCIAGAATGEGMLEKLRDFLKWLVTWGLRMTLYVFTGYMGITGVVSGTADAAALKATRLTMTGFVPVIGGILSEASEAVLVGAGVMKNAVGIYGLLAVIAIFITPFLRIGVMYLLLKLTAALCEIFEVKPVNSLIQAFSSAMGLLLGMTGSVCVMLLISTVCFMKGVA